ncbi:DnaC DNA replication protein [uncultured Caudovirales phage]|uniref:DnaC DNA replication protein n=1 Tax=uncultured Caudovirales phage TaxID=2100421 RepID=A0A6J5LTL3_9CAUD|nr:DnaC DNA replication protein [uncultured Caudovirales phage]
MEVSNEVMHGDCHKHGKYMAQVFTILGKKIASPCPSCKSQGDEAAQSRQKAIEQESTRLRQETLLGQSGIPLRFKTKTFDNYEANTEEQAKALRITRAYVQDWDKIRERGTCLIITGKVGTGKTHLACAIASEVIGRGASARFIAVIDALRLVKSSYDRSSTSSEGDAIAELVKPRLLILDEVGAELGSDHSKTILFDVINKRYENIKPTIILTNLDAASLREYVGERIVDRLREGGGKMVSLDWASHRG